MSLIRQRFGEVQVVSGKGRKNGVTNDVNIQRKESKQMTSSVILKSREIANRIAKLKHQLDQLTDSESWIITRIENVFMTANNEYNYQYIVVEYLIVLNPYKKEQVPN
eukprot:TRINITY_DN12080_c0_g1_i1.p1 TRINITY_DN12080_c0_g1~~TRINITY_DN12080_c0_g1_i1.p1  ORF type:complete len:108 (+),score=14.11 TRINITY_DN12080_c0_g1_i1:43-366(+)